MKISKQHAEHYVWGENCDGWHLLKNKNLSVIHERIPASTSEVKHYHQHARQFFFILSGTASIVIDNKEINLKQHEGLEVPPLVTHQIFNKSGDDIEFLVISLPIAKGDRILILER